MRCRARYEGGQRVCNRCGLVWDLDDTDPPACRTVRDVEMTKIKGILKMNTGITLCTNIDCTMRADCRRATDAIDQADIFGRALGYFTPHNYSMGPRSSNEDRCAFYITPVREVMK